MSPQTRLLQLRGTAVTDGCDETLKDTKTLSLKNEKTKVGFFSALMGLFHVLLLSDERLQS